MDTVKSVSNPNIHGGVVTNPDGTNIGSTAPSSLPLPTGAATSANQQTIIDTYKEEDTAYATGNLGPVIMAVRNDGDLVLTTGDLKYSPISVTDAGLVKTQLTDSAIDLPVDLAMINGITTAVGAGTSDTGTQRVVTALIGSPLVGQKAMTGSAVQLQTNTLVNGVIITAKSSNAANILIGTSGVTTTADGSGNGYILEPGASVSFAGTNTNLLYAIGTSADVLSFMGC